jgi:hypothetical protein
MKYLLYIVISLFVAALLSFAIFDREQPRPSNDQRAEEQQYGSQRQWETKTDEQPPVTIKVTPIELGRKAETWKFGIVLDTHSGSLSDDLLEAVSLVDENGNAYQPISWEGAGPGGHHQEGVLVFNVIDPAPPYVEVRIKNVGGIPQRLFAWSIE